MGWWNLTKEEALEIHRARQEGYKLYPIGGGTGAELLVGSLVVGLIGAGVSAYGQYQQGQMQAKAMEYNAEVQRTQAALARQKSALEEWRIHEKHQIAQGKMESSIAKAGVTTEGSPLLGIMEAKRMEEIDVAAQRQTGATMAWGYEANANLLNMQAGFAREAGAWGAGASLLGGLGGTGINYWNSYMKYQYLKG